MSEDEITLKDIETMIRILRKYLRYARQVENLLRSISRLSGYGGGGGYSFTPEGIARMLFEDYMARRGMGNVIEEDVEEGVELTEEEKKLIEKLRKKRGG